jgi:hypothetical protein
LTQSRKTVSLRGFPTAHLSKTRVYFHAMDHAYHFNLFLFELNSWKRSY